MTGSTGKIRITTIYMYLHPANELQDMMQVPFLIVISILVQSSTKKTSKSGIDMNVIPWGSTCHVERQLNKLALSTVQWINNDPNFDYLVKYYPRGWGNIILNKFKEKINSGSSRKMVL